MNTTDFQAILQRLDKIETAIDTVRRLIVAQLENSVDSGFYQEQVKRLTEKNRDLEYQQALQGKYTIDHNGKLVKNDAF